MTDVVARLSAALSDRYRLEGELGQGGMATVYLAEDLRHGRKVAIKVLHPELSAVIGSDRFLAEIKVTANLQHPHILGLIDSGDADGLLYYVMPYVAGESLRARLSREKQLPVGDALRLSKEVASALDYAHRQGVVHRDIKPENILLNEGSALVADFGIALAVQQAGGSRMTQTGMSLGTPAYMSPEQAMGERDIGPGSDVYALGAMTYEMLSGEPPFTGPNSQAIIAKVLTETAPSLRAKRPTVAPAVEHAVLTALQKLPADRFGSAREFADALEGKGTGASHAAAVNTRAQVPPPSLRGRAAAVATYSAVGLISALGAWAFLHGRDREAAPTAPLMRFDIAPPPGYQIASSAPSLSRDGQLLAFLADSAGALRLFLRRAGTAGVRQFDWAGDIVSDPVLSPDGKSIVFHVGKHLLRAPIDGSQPPAPVPGAPDFPPLTTRDRAFDVADDGAIFGTPDFASGLLRLDAASQRLDTLRRVNVDAGEYGIFYPSALPGGRVVLFSLLSRSGFAVMARTVDGKREVKLIEGATAARFGAPSSLVFSRNGNLYLADFDPVALKVRGDPRPLAQGLPVSVLAGSNAAIFSLSQAGILAVITGQQDAEAILTLVNRDGSNRTALRDSIGARARFAPDGQSIVAEDSSVVWLYDLARGGTRTRFSRGHLNYVGVWTPDGKRIVTSTYDGGPAQLWSYSFSDPSEAKRLSTSLRRRYAASFTPDGSALAFVEINPDGGADILVRHADGSEEPIARTAASEHHPRFSPNGRWLAYASEETGKSEVYMRVYPGAGRPVRVSVDGGNAPVWDPSGRELLFLHGTEIMSVTIAGDAVPTAGPPRLVLRVPKIGVFDEISWPFDISPDGRRFLIEERPATRPIRGLQVMVNLPAQP